MRPSGSGSTVAKKKIKDEKDVGDLVSDLIADVGADRDRLVSFLDSLISQYNGDQSVGIAEYVAKLADALTRQHAIKAGTIKALLSKKIGTDEEQMDLDELSDEIGKPFEIEESDGSN